jgi:hypothetical protein
MVYGCEGDLHSDLVAKILEHYVVEILGIIDCDVPRYAIAVDDVLSEEFFDCRGGYVCDRLRLNPFCEILNCRNGEGVITLCRG